MIEQGLFKRHFVGRDGFQWWIGQLPPEEFWRENIAGVQSEDNGTQKGFGERYRVRILGYHTANADDIPDEELPWAYVMYPVTAGGGGRGSSQSANLTQGTFVFGFFLDGEDAQLPIIMGVLGQNDYAAVMKNVTPTRFIPFDGYPEQDEVMGSERSALQVRQSGGGETLQQDNSEGQPTNEQYTSSAQGNTSVKPQADPKKAPDPVPLAETSEHEKSPMGDVQATLRNTMNEVHKFNTMIYDARSSITAGIADVQIYIENLTNKATSAVAGAIKWIFTEMQKFTLKQMNNISKKTYSIVFPNQREKLRLGVAKANDAITCVIRNLINELPGLVGDFLNDMVGNVSGNGPKPVKLINVPRCFVEDFMGTIMGNTAGKITDIISQSLQSVDSIIGQVTDVIGGVMGFVEDALAFLTCAGVSDLESPAVNEWSIWSGPGSKGGPGNKESLVSSVKNVSSKVKNVSSKISGVGSNLGDIGSSLSGLRGNVDFSDVFKDAQCDLGPRPCGTPTVEYIGDGAGAQINLVVTNGGEVIAADVISSGIGYKKGRSYIRVYDDCGIGKGAVIKPIFGEVSVVPIENIQPGIDPATGLPLISIDARNTDADSNKIASNGQDIIAKDLLSAKVITLPTKQTGRPGDSLPTRGSKDNIEEIQTKPKRPNSVNLEKCRTVDFKLQRSSELGTSPIRLTFTLMDEEPDYKGDKSFEFLITESGSTQTQCVYPNMNYLVTATTIGNPQNQRFVNARLDGEYDPRDPDNIRVRITRGQSENAKFGDYPTQTSLDGLKSGNGIWADYKDTRDDTLMRKGGIPLGSAGPRDFQVYPDKGLFKEIYGVSDDRVIYRLDAKPLPTIPLPEEDLNIGIVDVIVTYPGYDYLTGPNGAQGGDGGVWAGPDNTVITAIPPGSSTDYYPPIPPGNTVSIPPDGVVTTPIDSEPTEGVSSDGEIIPIPPGVPTPFPGGGSLTTPPIIEDGGDFIPQPGGGDFIPQPGGGGEQDVGVDAPEFSVRRSLRRYPSTDAYPVILYLCEIIVDKSGIDYQPGDEVIIEPNHGAKAEAKFDEYGRVLSVKVTEGGEGFVSVPKVFIKSKTGFGSKLIPKFCIDRVGLNDLERNPALQDQIISVVDCVGKV